MANFKTDAYNPDRTEIEAQYSLTFTDASPNAPISLSQVSSAGTVTSGTLPVTGAWVSGTAKQNPVARDIHVIVEVVGDNSANAATCAIAISPNNSDYTTVGTATIDASVNTGGVDKQVIPVPLPVGWYIKLTLSHATVAASYYY